MIRVLHVLGALDCGGAETMVMNLYRNIDRSKIQFDFVIHTKRKCYYTDEIKTLGGRIFSIQRYKGINHFSYVKEWNSFFKMHPEYRIIHAHMRSTAAIFLKIANKYGLYTIAHSHNTSSGDGLKATIKNTLQYPIRYIADYYFACSKKAGIWLFGDKIVHSNRFRILNNAIDSKQYKYSKSARDSIRKSLGIRDQAFVIGNIGRFHPQKNQLFLIDIFQKFHERDKNAVLILVGDGDLRNMIEEKIKSYNLQDNVVLTGVRDDIPQLLSVMDVFVFPSLFEGLGIVAIESQAAGLHTLCAETIPKEANITQLFKYMSLNASAEEWADKILEYCDRYEREDMSDKIAEAGYDISRSAKWIEQFYTRINTKKLSRMGLK